MVIEYYTPYVTYKGLPITLKLALKNVVVNTIIGISIIKAVLIFLDTVDNVITSKTTATNPFPVTYKTASCPIPDLLKVKNCNLSVAQPLVHIKSQAVTSRIKVLSLNLYK